MSLDTFTVEGTYNQAINKATGKSEYRLSSKSKRMPYRQLNRCATLPFNKLNETDQARYIFRLFDDGTFRIRASAASILQGHNFCGKNDASTLIPQAVLAILDAHELQLDEQSLNRIGKGEMKILELDIAGYLFKPKEVTMHRLQEKICDTVRNNVRVTLHLNSKHPGARFGNGDTFSILIYDKRKDAKKLTNKHGIFSSPDKSEWPIYREPCLRFLRRYMRVEARFRRAHLLAKKITRVNQLSLEQVRTLFNYAVEELLPKTIELEISDVEKRLSAISNPDHRRVARAYYQGQDIRRDYGKENKDRARFRRLKKHMAAYGINLDAPPPMETSRDVVVDLRRIELRPPKCFRGLTETLLENRSTR